MVPVQVPIVDEVSESYLVVRDVAEGQQITVIELLSPANKIHSRGRQEYETKRTAILSSRTSLVEIDLLRAGKPMRIVGQEMVSDYRILLSRGQERPRSYLLPFSHQLMVIRGVASMGRLDAPATCPQPCPPSIAAKHESR
jgi:hypothetical protein